MRRWFHVLDRILRGEVTKPAALLTQPLDVPIGGLSLVILLLALSYGACSGLYAGCRPEDPSWMQWWATTLKVPALLGSRLDVRAVAQLLIASLGVNLAVLASMGPIVGFFSFTTTSWPFIVLLNVLIYTVSGLLGMAFLLRTLQRLSIAQRWLAGRPTPREPGHESPQGRDLPTLDPASARPTDEPSALDSLEDQGLGRHVKTVFYCWMLIFALVGAQMAWVLRPFFGKPHEAFKWFSPRGSNFFEGVWEALRSLFS